MESPLTKSEERKFGYPKVRDPDVKNEKPKTEVRRLQYEPKSGDGRKICLPSCCPAISGAGDRLVCISILNFENFHHYRIGHTVGHALLPDCLHYLTVIK